MKTIVLVLLIVCSDVVSVAQKNEPSNNMLNSKLDAQMVSQFENQGNNQENFENIENAKKLRSNGHKYE